jgi:predicted transcriptional regulator
VKRLGRPPMPLEERRVPVHFRLPPAVLARLDELAEAWDVTRTGALERLVKAQPRRG